MSSRYWLKFFLNTLLIGSITTGIVGIAVSWSKFASQSPGELFVGFLWMMGVGLIFSVISQMCFFAYLTVHRLGLSIFKSVSLWNAVQIVLIVFVLYDLAYLRFVFFAEKNETAISYTWFSLFILIVALIVGALKVKQTNKHAFVPAIFFMVVVTVVEWFPVLRVNEEAWMYFMLIPLMVCNAYQLLILPKYNEKSKIALEEKQKRTNPSTHSS